MAPEHAIQASPKVHALLKRLHDASSAQESSLSQTLWYARRLISYYVLGETWSAASDAQMLDKFVALEQDKCHIMYLLARSCGAKNIVEAGTSFGVSTIYLALAVGQNCEGEAGRGKVVATEKESVKAERARQHWKEAGDEVEPWVELRIGDLLETLREDGMPDVIDMLLLDIWTPLALPTLEIVKPRMRKGAMVLVDNTTWAGAMYKDLLNYLHDPTNEFKTTTTPYAGGFEVAIYLPQ